MCGTGVADDWSFLSGLCPDDEQTGSYEWRAHKSGEPPSVYGPFSLAPNVVRQVPVDRAFAPLLTLVALRRPMFPGSAPCLGRAACRGLTEKGEATLERSCHYDRS